MAAATPPARAMAATIRTPRRRDARRAARFRPRNRPPLGAPVHRQDLDRRHRLREALHTLDSPLAVFDAVDRARELEHGLCRQHITGPRQRAESRGEIERTAPVPLADRNRLAGVETDTDPERKPDAFLLKLERRPQRLPRRVEDDERLVAAQLDEPPLALLDDATNDLRKLRRGGGRGLVAVLDRVARVAAQVGDDEGADAGDRLPDKRRLRRSPDSERPLRRP